MTLDLVGRHVAMPMSYSLGCSYLRLQGGLHGQFCRRHGSSEQGLRRNHRTNYMRIREWPF